MYNLVDTFQMNNRHPTWTIFVDNLLENIFDNLVDNLGDNLLENLRDNLLDNLVDNFLSKSEITATVPALCAFCA